MTDIAIVSRSALLASGLQAALQAVPGWRATVYPRPVQADALVLHLDDDDSALPAWPAQMPCVLIGVGSVAGNGDYGQGQPRSDAAALALLSADATPAQVCAAVAATLQGLSVRGPGLSFASAGLHAAAGEHEPLTPREIEVYELIGKGLSNRDIASVLGISAHTAKYHVSQILAKVGAATRAEAVSAGLRIGLIGL